MILLIIGNVLNQVTVFKRFRKTTKNDSYFYHVLMEQLDSHWTDFHEI